jgi:hypothetical protein
MNTEIMLRDLPECVMRSGQVIDGNLEIGCGKNIIDPIQCVKCSGFDGPMIIQMEKIKYHNDK